MEDQGVKKLARNGLITQRSEVQILSPQPTVFLQLIHRQGVSTTSVFQPLVAYVN
jgi:hypothetical protein